MVILDHWISQAVYLAVLLDEAAQRQLIQITRL